MLSQKLAPLITIRQIPLLWGHELLQERVIYKNVFKNNLYWSHAGTVFNIDNVFLVRVLYREISKTSLNWIMYRNNEHTTKQVPCCSWRLSDTGLSHADIYLPSH